MPHDPALVADTRAWLSKARMDLLAAEAALALGREVYGAVLSRLPEEVRP